MSATILAYDKLRRLCPIMCVVLVISASCFIACSPNPSDQKRLGAEQSADATLDGNDKMDASSVFIEDTKLFKIYRGASVINDVRVDRREILPSEASLKKASGADMVLRIASSDAAPADAPSFWLRVSLPELDIQFAGNYEVSFFARVLGAPQERISVDLGDRAIATDLSITRVWTKLAVHLTPTPRENDAALAQWLDLAPISLPGIEIAALRVAELN